jgi:hypothetical protein
MENNVKVQTLVQAYEMARKLSEFYISKLDGIDVKKVYEIEGVKMNTAYWILAHLVWTEHFLIIEGVGGDSIGIEWLNDFAFGTDPDSVATGPSFEEILKTRGQVHTRAMEVLNNLTDEQLDEDNNIEATFGGSSSKGAIIMHAIRHEPMHIGQISWILKVNKIKMV